jgi:hypothetical protein
MRLPPQLGARLVGCDGSIARLAERRVSFASRSPQHTQSGAPNTRALPCTRLRFISIMRVEVRRMENGCPACHRRSRTTMRSDHRETSSSRASAFAISSSKTGRALWRRATRGRT